MSRTRLNMVPFRYPWAYQKFQDAMDNNWTPKEVNMSSDPMHYKHDMPEDIKFMFRTQLSDLTTSDIQIMDNVLAGITGAIIRLGVLDAPEIRMYLARQGFEEALHSHSYQYILESLGMSPHEQEEFYTIWERVPEIRQRINYAAGITESFLSNDITIPDLICYMSWYYCLYEGGHFYNCFNPLLAITHWMKFAPGTAEQLGYIRRDEALHINFGIDMINTLRLEHGTPHDFSDRMYTFFIEGLELEEAYIKYLMKDVQMIGYNVEKHLNNFKHLMNIRASKLGVKTPFPEIKETPHSWLGEASDFKKETNFFEKRVIEYRAGGLSFDDSDENMDTLHEWNQKRFPKNEDVDE